MELFLSYGIIQKWLWYPQGPKYSTSRGQIIFRESTDKPLISCLTYATYIWKACQPQSSCYNWTSACFLSLIENSHMVLNIWQHYSLSSMVQKSHPSVKELMMETCMELMKEIYSRITISKIAYQVFLENPHSTEYYNNTWYMIVHECYIVML